MNSETIMELANQLGIAADDAASFAQAITPSFAAKGIVMNASIAAVFMVFTAVLLVLTAKIAKKANRVESYEREDTIMEAWLCGLFAAIMLVLAVFFAAQAVSWVIAPDAMVAQKVLNMMEG